MKVSIITYNSICNHSKLTTLKRRKQHLHCAHMCKHIYSKKPNLLFNKHKNILYISIEGSNTLVNWVDNVSLIMKRNDIHRGFTRYATYLLNEFNIFDIFEDIHEYDKIILTGHSLGSASATLIAYELCKKQIAQNADNCFQNKFELVLFGCPKIGGDSFKNEFNDLVHKTGLDVFNYENINDVVCKIPFSIFGYASTFLESDSVFLEGVDTPFWEIYQNHSMSQYLDLLYDLNLDIEHENKK